MTNTDTLPSRIPTDPDELANLLRVTEPHLWYEVHQRLRTQIGGGAADKLVERVESEIMHERNIDVCRDQLRAAIKAATAEIGNAQRAIEELAGGSMYDVEYAEGLAAGDMRSFLSAAARALRAAAALNPVPEPPVERWTIGESVVHDGRLKRIVGVDVGTHMLLLDDDKWWPTGTVKSVGTLR